jgi:hypothetical protein
MSNRLIINPGTPQAWQIELKPGLNRIGRTDENDFSIPHQSVSTHHCEITVTDTTVTLKDLGSTNGTFVERVPVTEFKLHNGQHVQFGSVDMVFETDIAPALPSPAVNLPATGAKIVLANPGPAAPPPPPPPAPAGGLRINRDPQPHMTGGTPPPPSPVGSPMLKPIASSPAMSRPAIKPAHANAQVLDENGDGKLNTMGIVGAVAGALLAMAIWYAMVAFTGSSWGIVAWGVGVVVGFGGRLLGKASSYGLGLVCGVCALIAILGGEYFGIRGLISNQVSSSVDIDYSIDLEASKEIGKLETPEQMRAHIAKQEDINESEVTGEQLTNFQNKELPILRDLASGKMTKKQYTDKKKAEIADGFSYKEYFFEDDIKSGIFMLIFTALGVGTAFKIGAGTVD